MRVTHVITRLIVGGAQENTIASVLGLREKAGLEVDLISGPTYGPEGTVEAGVTTVPGLLTVAPNLVRPIHPWKDARTLAGLTRLFRQRSPDVVHTHSGKAGILGRIAARRARVPIIVHTIHGPSFGPFQGWLPNRAFTAAERYAARFTTHFVSVAQAMTDQYLAAGVGRAAQFTRIVSGFNLSPFLEATNDPGLRARWGFTSDDIVVGKIARLAEKKGHEDLFAIAPELVRRCPRMKFLLVGDGKWRSRFEESVRALGLAGHVRFTGLVRPDEVPALVGIMDLLVHLSYREGLPRALPQALAAGRPVLAYDCDGAREVCLSGQTGFLVPPGRKDSLRDRLLELTGDPALRERLGRHGQQLVRDQFSVERMVDQLHTLYLRLAREHGIGGGLRSSTPTAVRSDSGGSPLVSRFTFRSAPCPSR